MDSFTSETEGDIIVSSGSASEEDDKQPSSYKGASTLKGWFQGHSFVKKNLHKPATCHHCSDLLWGILGTTGMVCEVCNFLAHEKCMRVVVTACTCIAPFLTKDPVPHCWSEIGHFKRKFCNVCRKRVDDLLALKCEICEYYSHYECLDFVAADCKQCAISTLTSAPKRPTNIPGTVETRNSYMMSRLLRNFSKFYTSNDPNELPLVDLADYEMNYKSISNASTTFTTNISSGANNTVTSCSTANTSSLSPITQSSLTSTPKTSTQHSSEGSGFALFEVTNALSLTSATTLTTLASSEEQASGGGTIKSTVNSSSLSPSANSSTTASSSHVQQSHHWREGNLPVNSKCASCRKTCWSAECLTGIRCEWCGVTVSDWFPSMAVLFTNMFG
ncbi:unnamed protein product [Heterobilharzia americana]|nr:unnamed protein product [Heterobilharzia americana]